MSDNLLLVPIQVEALVIDSYTISQAPSDSNPKGTGCWSPKAGHDLSGMTQLKAPGAPPFLDATPDVSGVLHFGAGNDYAPKAGVGDEGVHLRWRLPDALVGSHGPSSRSVHLPVPDQWIVMRMARKTSDGTAIGEATAWVIDSWAEDGSATVANLLTLDSGAGQAVKVGTKQALGAYQAPATAPSTTDPLTVLGNSLTALPTFTVPSATNHNVCSMHDDLSDIAELTTGVLTAVPGHTGARISLSYFVMGWTRDAAMDPLKTIQELLPATAAELTPEELLQALHWGLDELTKPPADLVTSGRSIFHGMTAGINYWDDVAYKGGLLGYPGSPARWDATGDPPKPLQLAVAQTAPEAMATLASLKQSPGLEAIFYGEDLQKGVVRDAASLPYQIEIQKYHFNGHPSGFRWTVIKADGHERSGAPVRITPDIWDALGTLNEAQEALDAASREWLGHQHSAYAAWWLDSAASRSPGAHHHHHHHAGSSHHHHHHEGAGESHLAWSSVSEKFSAIDLASLQSTRDTCLETLLDALPVDLLLRWVPKQSFEHPTDLAMAANLTGWAGTSPIKSTPDAPLPCRTTTQAVSTITQPATRVGGGALSTTADAWHQLTAASTISSDLSALLSAASNSDLATTAEALIQEALLAEQGVSKVAQNSFPTGLRKISTHQTWIDGLRSMLFPPDPDHPGCVSTNSANPTLGLKTSKGATIFPGTRVVQVWGKQPWAPLHVDWHLNWHASETPLDGTFGTDWNFGAFDYRSSAANNVNLTTGPIELKGRSLVSEVDRGWFDRIVKSVSAQLKKLSSQITEAEGKLNGLTAGTDPYKNQQAVIKGLQDQLALVTAQKASLTRMHQKGGVFTHYFGGFQEKLLSREAQLPLIRPGDGSTTIQWNQGGAGATDADVQAKLAPVSTGPSNDGQTANMARLHLAPPSTTGVADYSFVRSGFAAVEQVWVVDEFGQWADLVYGPGLRAVGGFKMHRRLKAPANLQVNSTPPSNINSFAALPPRFLQPTRLQFDFVSAQNPATPTSEDPRTSPIAGWVIYNHVDQSLLLFESGGQVLGELQLSTSAGSPSAIWECLAEPRPSTTTIAGTIKDPTLEAFVSALQATPATLQGLMDVIDQALPTIRPSGRPTGVHFAAMYGRPLALVNLKAKLELLGGLWPDPFGTIDYKNLLDQEAGYKKIHDSLQVPVRLGVSSHLDDGLIGYFPWAAAAPSTTDFAGIVPFDTFDATGAPDPSFITDPSSLPLKLAFNSEEMLSVLMDPVGHVNAIAGVTPKVSRRIPGVHVRDAMDRLEVAMRVEPLLERSASPGVRSPTPTTKMGRWFFEGPDGSLGKSAVHPPNVRPHFDGANPRALGGHLVLRNAYDKAFKVAVDDTVVTGTALTITVTRQNVLTYGLDSSGTAEAAWVAIAVPTRFLATSLQTAAADATFTAATAGITLTSAPTSDWSAWIGMKDVDTAWIVVRNDVTAAGAAASPFGNLGHNGSLTLAVDLELPRAAKEAAVDMSLHWAEGAFQEPDASVGTPFQTALVTSAPLEPLSISVSDFALEAPKKVALGGAVTVDITRLPVTAFGSTAGNSPHWLCLTLPAVMVNAALAGAVPGDELIADPAGISLDSSLATAPWHLAACRAKFGGEHIYVLVYNNQPTDGTDFGSLTTGQSLKLSFDASSDASLALPGVLQMSVSWGQADIGLLKAGLTAVERQTAGLKAAECRIQVAAFGQDTRPLQTFVFAS